MTITYCDACGAPTGGTEVLVVVGADVYVVCSVCAHSLKAVCEGARKKQKVTA